ncbi:SusC/RagA family TonB-linked outer membrane protein [Pedobacter insulae]|uniref:TonB-linked outer membrane protein, SusC/RagA family n=1 Tax=Pedobacter insulae TaxID=414048 RepID=A0A1I2ZMK6_9SPHI|nr:TonB-dependent receptor [Pedobacter insulae]SFH38950.1 TonB-linked outer membrane protein, SusC/RagA family [Pedobacter insulae]
MTRKDTNLIKHMLGFKDGGFIAIAFTLALFISFYSEAMASSANFNRTNSAKRSQFDITIRGIVKDSTGAPLPGAGVRVKGISTSAVADVNGAFTIAVPNQSSVLVVTYVGYDVQEITVGNKTTIEVIMKETAGANLKEVAIVGFGVQKKESLVGAQSSVNAAELRQPVSSMSQLLAGRIPGVVNVSRNGEPGATGSDIFIRGISSLTAGDRGPLVIIDGVPNRNLNDISVYDVENFTVLKDAAATAVYGIRGANGVILINTKQGKQGSPKINVDYFEGVSRFTKRPDLIDGVDYMNLANEAKYSDYIRGGAAGAFTPAYPISAIEKTAAGTDPILFPNVNWFDAIYNDIGRNRSATANLSGGVSNAKYFVSLGYYGEDGLFKTDEAVNSAVKQNFSRYNVSANLNWDITGTTKLDLGIKGILAQTNYPSNLGAQDIFNQAFLINPTSFPILYPNGSLPGISPQADQRNPYGDITRNGYRIGYNNQLYSNLRLTQDLKELTPGLSVTTMFSYDINNNNAIARTKRETLYRINPTDPYITPGNPESGYKYGLILQGQDFLNYGISNGGDKKMYFEAAVNYNRVFGKHAVTGLLLYNQNDNTTPFAGNLTLSLPYRLQGVASRATYAFDNKYFFEANVGYNGSENFAPDKRYGFFPAIGIGWLLSNEKFFENLKNTFQMVKFRYSDGIVGSGGSGGGYAGSEGDRFYYLTKVGTASGYTFGQNGNISPGGLGVTAYGVDVTWAETRKQDLGFELKTFNSNFTLIVDFYKERRENQFISRGTVPNYIGLANTPIGNLGIVENKGIDGSIQYDAKLGSDWSLNVRANATFNKDKVIENDQAPAAFPWLEQRGTNILASTRFGYVAEKLFESQQEIDASPTQFGTLMPGDIKYRDLNGDGKIDSFDRQMIGRGDIPSTTYGAGFSLSYKNFDFGLFFQGQHNADIILNIPSFANSGGLGNMLAVATDRWTPTNPRQDAVYPRLSYGGTNNNNYQASTWWLRDVNFLRLKNADFGYTLKEGIKTLGVKRLRIYAMGYNVLTFSKFKLWDPELLTNNGTRYPLTSNYSLGLTANF